MPSYGQCDDNCDCMDKLDEEQARCKQTASGEIGGIVNACMCKYIDSSHSELCLTQPQLVSIFTYRVKGIQLGQSEIIEGTTTQTKPRNSKQPISAISHSNDFCLSGIRVSSLC